MTTRPFLLRREVWIVAVLLFASYAYFYEAGGWNQNSRFALVRAILEEHTVRVDSYESATGDKAKWRGHYYSDKAPGTAFLAVVPAGAARIAARAVDVDPASRPGIAWTSYVATVFTSGLFSIVAALTLMWIAIEWGATPGAAAFAALGYGIATPAWAYATLFMGHAMAAGCLMLAFAAAVALSSPSTRYRAPIAAALGLAGGWAVVTEFPAAIPLAFIVLLVFVEGSRSSPALATRTTAVVLAGGLVTAAVLMAYNSAAFGSPFHLGYASEQGFEQLRVGLFGITYPTLDRLRGILFSAYRGVIPLAPLTLAAALGLGALAADRATRRPAVVATGIVIFYLLLNASYYYWEGGWAYGPRHITPALPFLFLGLAPLWDRWRGAARWVLVAACVWGAALGLIAVSTTAQPPGDVMSPVTELLWPAFRDGDLSLNNQGFADARADEGRLRNHLELHAGWNLGELAGFHGRASLIPLGAIWVIGLGGLVRSRQT